MQNFKQIIQAKRTNGVSTIVAAVQGPVVQVAFGDFDGSSLFLSSFRPERKSEQDDMGGSQGLLGLTQR